MQKNLDEKARLTLMTGMLERYAAFMAVILGQGALDALDFVCEEAAANIVESDLGADSSELVLADFRKIRSFAQQAFDAARKH